ncbi:WYL domain-containing protein [Actinomadura roseirufa]|uniref:WYL domain-containing protein n=1 Tax=Actinomadura roseirufa TaxID=2094049 RepID=UPI0035224D66
MRRPSGGRRPEASAQEHRHQKPPAQPPGHWRQSAPYRSDARLAYAVLWWSRGVHCREPTRNLEPAGPTGRTGLAVHCRHSPTTPSGTKQRIQIRYRRWQHPQQVTRVLAPLGIVLKAGSWYLIARSDDTLRRRAVRRCVRGRRAAVAV